MGVTAVVLLALLGAAPAAPTKVLLLPLPADASDGARALHDALTATLISQRGLSLVSAPGLEPESSIAGDERLGVEIDEVLARVQDAWRRLDVEEATRLLQSLENARLSELGCPERIALAGRISFWLGIVYATRKDTARATERFSTVLSIDPGWPIDPKYFPPATVTLFEKVRKALGAARTGGLSLSTEPEGARVYLNGKLAGQAPVTLTAADGEHFVCVRRAGWKDWAARLHLSAGRVDTQRIYLQRATPDAVARQLAAVLGIGPVRLDDAAHLEALGAALAVDVVVDLRAPATLAWRSVLAPAEPHQLVAPSAGALAQTVAGELAVALAEALGVRAPVPQTSVEGPVVVRRFDVEGRLYGGLVFTMGRGGFFGAQLGFWWNASPSFGVGLRAGVAKGFADLGLFDPNPVEKLVVATAVENLEAPFSFGVRWHAIHANAFRLSLEANATLRLLNYAGPTVIPNLPLAVPLVTIPMPQPLSPTTLGPHVGLSASYAVQPGVALTAGLEYGLEVALSRPEVGAVIMPRGGGPTMPIRLTSESIRHVLSLDLGVQLRFQ